MNKSPNGFRHLSLFGCFVCLVGWPPPTFALAVSATHHAKVACFAHRAKLKGLWHLGEPCATLLKKDGTEWPIKIISRGNGMLTCYLCDDPEKSPQSISYDAISAVRMPNNALWRPNRSRAPGKDARGYWGVASLSLSIFGLLTTPLSLGAILCTAGIFVGATGLIRRTKQRWAAILGIALGAVPLILGLAGVIPLAVL